MIKLDRQTLPIIRTDTELDAVDWDIYLEALLRQPSNIVYFETEKRLYGMVSYGDVKRARDQGSKALQINRNFTYLTHQDYMKARQIFREHPVMSEIPVVENERLAGEFNRFDSLLLLTRMRDWKYNSDAPRFWKDAGKVALIRPGSGRETKEQIYHQWCRELTKYEADYTCINLIDLPGQEKEFQSVLFVDDIEQRGARIFMEFFAHRSFGFDIYRTYHNICMSMARAGEIDYHDIIDEYSRKGVRVLTLSVKDPCTDYSAQILRECAQRYPVVEEAQLNKLMIEFEREFFDDRYTPEYARTMEEKYFDVENTRSGLSLIDEEGPYINIRSGKRVTTDQPEDYTRTVFFFGQCLIMGQYVSDDQTIESHLQRMINEHGLKVRVVNCGCWGGNIADYARMASSLIREGDIIVWFPEKVNLEGSHTLNLWEALEKEQIPSEWFLDNVTHCNHHVTHCYARAIFDRLFGQDYADQSKTKPLVKRTYDSVRMFYGDKYFYGWSPEKEGKICGMVINGNPFTSGHMHLVKTAAETMDYVILFSVQEENGIFTYAERYAMICDVARQFPNVTVVPGGLFLGNGALFPNYFLKIYNNNVVEQAKLEVESFVDIAHMLGINYRIAGEEPHDPITEEINHFMRTILPREGIELMIIDRYAVNGEDVTGTIVRDLIERNADELAQYVPETTMKIIKGAGF